MFKKEDIKPGMLVEVKIDYNGSKSLMYVTECTNGIVFIDKDDCYSMLKTYNDNLEGTCSKIMKVYGFSEYECKSRSISTEDRELLWDRGDEVDWSKVKVDTKVLVRNPSISKSWSKAYFAKYKDGNVYVYDGGKTSWSGGLITYWAEAKLYKEDE